MSETIAKPAKPPMPMWLILVTLLGGAFLVQRGSAPSADDKEAAPPVAVSRVEDTSSEAMEDRMLAPLREFLGLSSAPAAAAGPAVLGKLNFQKSLSNGSRIQASAEWTSKQPTSERIKGHSELKKRIRSHVGLLEFLVVTVADPIETAANYRFDLQLDTLHKALGADGYVPDRFYLPWNPQDKSNLHRQEPGVLLYRRNGRSEKKCENAEKLADPKSRNDLLLVYLVGETPTAGIHKAAFLAAVEQIATLGKMPSPQEHCGPSKVRIVGPLFTGAADSLALAIRQAREDKITQDDFQVITGTAISIDIDRFESLAGKEIVDLHSTVLYGRVLKQALIKHVLERTWSKKVRIAWLTETGTGYGSSSSNREKIDHGPETENSEESSNQVAEIIEFSFPVNISKVRSGYAESRRRERSSQTSLGPEGSRLKIPFEDVSTARDLPPMQTPKVTAPTAELVLEQILATIRNQRIKYVGISATDARDPIFLSELIKEHCPDVQIMLVTSDLLHLHSEYSSVMQGTLVSSSHPLNPESQEWCFPFGEQNRDGLSRSYVLSSQPNYGLYNAVLFQRGLERGYYQHIAGNDGHSEIVLDSSKGWPVGLPLGYSMPFQNLSTQTPIRPPVWISRIGATGIIPISVQDNLRQEEGHEDESKEDESLREARAYTLSLRLAQGTKPGPLPKVKIRTQVPTSLSIVGLCGLVIASLYYAALNSRRVANLASPLVPVAGQPQQFMPLIHIFRSYITGSFLYVLLIFGSLMAIYHQRVGVRSFGDFLTLAQGVSCFVMSLLLIRCQWVDWKQAILTLIADLFRAVQTRRAHLTPASEPARTNASTEVAEPDLRWHLIAAGGVGLASILTLTTIFIVALIVQLLEWRGHSEDTFLWFNVTSDMWNGLSSAMTGQFLAVAVIILAYGMLSQMHQLSWKHTIVRPDPTNTGVTSRKDRKAEVRNDLLFPLLSRWLRGRPIVLRLLCVSAVLAWLGFLRWHLQSPDFFALPVSFSSTMLLFVGGYWCVRLFKLIQILEGLEYRLTKLKDDLKDRWPDTWTNIFGYLPAKLIGLKELFWTRRPTVNDQELEKARRNLKAIEPDEIGRLKAEQKVCAIEIELYVRQFFHHIVRLGMGLAVSACLLFLSAQTFPYSQEPLLRLSSSIMLVAIGCVMAWYYLKFDRHELLSHLVGTDPKQISINWSMIQMIAPAVLLTAVAILSQAFPELWQWVRGVVEPMSRSSI